MAKKLANSAKTKAWNAFSQWVRVRDCLRTTGLPFVGICVTCGLRFHIRFLQAGHCFPGRRNARLCQEELVNAQCRFCNEGKHGCYKKYKAIMIQRYGEEQVRAWEIEGKKIIHDRDMDFPAIEKIYRDKTNVLLRQHGRYVSYEDMLKEE